jgi:hypothetical protein
MHRHWPIFGFVFLLGVVAHVESLGYWFTAPDTFALIETSRITSFADIWTILTEPLMYGTSYVNIGLFYRPVVNLTFAVDYWLWGLNPFGYHLTNILLHGVAAALVVGTVRSLTASSRVGGLTGILFAIHPLSVDTVPAISRRQDILLAIFGLLTLWLFVESLRQEEAQRFRIGAAVAYALALLSKETAIVLGPLVFLWAVFQQPSLRRPRAYWRAFRAVLPLAVVAVAYLAVRFAVLGGIGGYSRSPPLSTMLLIPVEYVLALVYPAHTFGALGDVFLPLAIAFTVGVPVAYLALFRREQSFRELGSARLLLVAVAVVGFVAVAAMLMFPSVVRSVLVKHPHVGWVAVGLVFTLAATSAVAAALSCAQVFAAGDHRLDAFFLVWLVIPVPVFLIGKEFMFRSAYFFVIPFIALLATYLVKFLTLLTEGRVGLSAGTDAAFALIALVLLVPSLAASPLLYTDSGWDAAGDITKQTLTGVNDEVTEVNETTRVVVKGIPYRIRYHPTHLGEAREVTMLHPLSVQSWLHLKGHERSVAVRGRRSFRSAPHAVSLTTNRDGGTLIIHIQYAWQHTPAARDGMLKNRLCHHDGYRNSRARYARHGCGV